MFTNYNVLQHCNNQIIVDFLMIHNTKRSDGAFAVICW